MKPIFLLVTFILLSGQLHSQEIVSDEDVLKSYLVKQTTPLYNLMFYPAKGTFIGSTESINTVSRQNIDYDITNFAKTKTSNSLIKQKLAFAYNSNTLIGAALKYQVVSNTTSNYGFGSSLNGKSIKSKNEKGLKEPSVFISKKIQSQDTDNFDVDFAVIFSPKIGTAKSSTADKAGNALRGANELEFNFNIGKRNYQTSWTAGLVYSRTSEAKSENALTPENRTTTEVNNVLSGTFIYQWVMNSDFEINFNGRVAFLGKTNSTNQYSNTVNELDGATVITLGPTFILNYSPHLIFQLGLLTRGSSERVFKQTDSVTGKVNLLDYNQLTSGSVNLATSYAF